MNMRMTGPCCPPARPPARARRYADAGPNTRSTQLFINYGNNARLDGMGFAPFGKVCRPTTHAGARAHMRSVALSPRVSMLQSRSWCAES